MLDNIINNLSYCSPWAEGTRKAFANFKHIESDSYKARVILATIAVGLITIFTIPFTVSLGFAVFRKLVELGKIRPIQVSEKSVNHQASRVDQVSQPILLGGEILVDYNKILLELKQFSFPNPENDPRDSIAIIKNFLSDSVTQVFMHQKAIPSDLEGEFKTNLTAVIAHFERGCQDYPELAEILDGCYEELKDCSEMLGCLVEPTQRKTISSYLSRLITQTTDAEKITWKVEKYQQLIDQMRDFIGTLKGDVSGRLLEVLEIKKTKSISQEYLAHIRDVYSNQFLRTLQNELGENPGDPNLQAICYYLFTEISLDESNRETVDMFSEWGKEHLKEKTLDMPYTHVSVNDIWLKFQHIHAVPNDAKAPLLCILANSMRGVLNRNFEPFYQGNPTHKIYELSVAGKKVKALAFGTPTEEGWIQNAPVLNAPFLGYLRACKARGEKHLFVINQDATAEGALGAEKPRCDLIMNLQNDPEFKDTFYAITLSKNSLFYNQKKCEGNFKSQLVAQFKTEGTGCTIPDDVPVEEMVEKIHATLFGSREELDVHERKIFIEVLYDHITLYLIKSLNIDSFNISCKDAIDRGAASNAQLYSHMAIVSDEGFTEDNVERATVLMMARALLVRKRAPISERVERFLESLDFYLANAENLKSLMN